MHSQQGCLICSLTDSTLKFPLLEIAARKDRITASPCHTAVFSLAGENLEFLHLIIRTWLFLNGKGEHCPSNCLCCQDLFTSSSCYPDLFLLISIYMVNSSRPLMRLILITVITFSTWKDCLYLEMYCSPKQLSCFVIKISIYTTCCLPPDPASLLCKSWKKTDGHSLCQAKQRFCF